MLNASPSAASPNRPIFDFLKGIGILEVVLHHSLSFSASKHSTVGTLAWWAAKWGNRFFHFAIPLFLLVSACLLTRSLLGRNDLRRFVSRRFSRSLWPYLIWSGFYILVRVYVQKNPSDYRMATGWFPLIGQVQGHHLLVDLPGMAKLLLWGKAYFHLYFMSVLLQMALLLPLVVAIFKRARVPFWGAFLAAALLQYGAFVVQRDYVRFFAPASTVMWYLPSLILGAWIGANWKDWPQVWRRNRLVFGLLAVVGTVRYVYLEDRVFNKLPIVSLDYNSTFLVYAMGISLLLMGAAPAASGLRGAQFVRLFGQHSLPIFIIHPFVLYAIRGPRMTSIITALPASAIWCVLIVLSLSYGFARAVARVSEGKFKLDRLLFGQDLPRREELAISAPPAARNEAPQPA